MSGSEENYPQYKVRGGAKLPKMKMKAKADSKPKEAKKVQKKTSK